MTAKELEKWNERRFQICLKLIDKESSAMSNLDINVILQKAERLINALREKEESWNGESKE